MGIEALETLSTIIEEQLNSLSIETLISDKDTQEIHDDDHSQVRQWSWKREAESEM